MTAPIVEVIVSADAATTGAMVDAAAEGLPTNARVQVVERATPTADVIATVRWADEGEHLATIHVRLRDGREAARVLTFGSADPHRERGRALGFAIAAMIPADLRAAEGATAPVEVEIPAPPPTPHAAATEHAEQARPPAAARFALEAWAQGATGFVGSATSFGSALAVKWLVRPVALRVGAGLRGGSVSEADASSLLVRGDAGVGFFTVALNHRITLGGRGGLAIFHHAMVRSATDGQSTGTHTLLGAEIMLEAGVALSSSIALVAAVGSEVAFGTTRVFIGTERVALIPAVRPVAELGIQLSF